LIDVYPTLVELCSLKAPKEQLDGTSLVPILKNPELEGRKHVFIKRTNGYTLKTKAFSYTEFIKAADNSILDKMLYDHRESRAENINVVYKKEFLSIAAEMSQTLHSAYQKNIEGE
jgi:arylsulfatase A-like enzyme